MDPERDYIEAPFSIEYKRTITGFIDVLEDSDQDEIDVEIAKIEEDLDLIIYQETEFEVSEIEEDLKLDNSKEYQRGLSDGLEEAANHDEVKRLMEAEDVLKKLKTVLKEYIQNVKSSNDLFFNEFNFENDLELITKYFDND